MEGGVQSGQSDIGLYCWKTNQIRECEKRKKKSEFLGSQCWVDSKISVKGWKTENSQDNFEKE